MPNSTILDGNSSGAERGTYEKHRGSGKSWTYYSEDSAECSAGGADIFSSLVVSKSLLRMLALRGRVIVATIYGMELL